MKYHSLGKTGLFVSELCLGTMTFGEMRGIGGVSQEDATKMVKAAWEGGINFFDTADLYTLGVSEIMLGKALHELNIPRHKVILSTKANGRMDSTDINAQGQSRHHLFNAINDSLQRLQTDYIDLYLMHGWDGVTPLDESLYALDDLVHMGKVRYIGICNYAAWQIATALGRQDRNGLTRYVVAQLFYSLVNRDIENEVIPLAEYEGIGILPWSPLAGGFLSGKYMRGIEPSEGRFKTSALGKFPFFDEERGYRVLEALTQMAKEKGVTTTQLSLAWLLTRPTVCSVTIGAKRLDQLTENLGAVEITLSETELDLLDQASYHARSYPQWMIDRQVDPMRLGGKKW